MKSQDMMPRIYTMVEMAKAHSLNVEDYLMFLL